MSERMGAARFAALIDAYGAEPRRWPEEERAAAQAFARSDPRAVALLDAGADLDDLLLAHHVQQPSVALRAAVIASGSRRRLLARARLWWAALALGLAGAGGALAGSSATAALVPVPAHLLYGSDEATTPGDIMPEGES